MFLKSFFIIKNYVQIYKLSVYINILTTLIPYSKYPGYRKITIHIHIEYLHVTLIYVLKK